jgi:hypothetical protein
LQNAPVAQSVSAVHDVAHESLPPGQVKGAQAGAGVPAASVEHVPGVAAHVSHGPSHAVAQQYPSTQLPLAQSRHPTEKQSPSSPAAWSHAEPCALRAVQVPPALQ